MNCIYQLSGYRYGRTSSCLPRTSKKEVTGSCTPHSSLINWSTDIRTGERKCVYSMAFWAYTPVGNTDGQVQRPVTGKVYVSFDHIQSDHLALENCMCPAWRKFNTYQKDVVLISSEEGEGWLDTMGVQHAKRSKARPVCSRSIVTRGLFDTGDICIASRSIVREVASFTRVMDTKRGIKRQD